MEQKDCEKYFDHELSVKTEDPASTVQNVFLQMDNYIKDVKISHAKIVLLFDEAHGLMKGKDADKRGNLVFRAIRWWLRIDRAVKVMAVFAGTNSKLANFFDPDPPFQQVSRDAQRRYKNDEVSSLRLYDPFYELYTIGCFRDGLDDKTKDSNPETSRAIKSDKSTTDTRTTKDSLGDSTMDKPSLQYPCGASAAKYGRPLFAYYQLKTPNQLSEKLAEIGKRLALSVDEYTTSKEACFSILGTRVQMGVVDSFELQSRLVSSGYACLSDFHMEKDPKGKDRPVARVVFMPDPVCAMVAMWLMKGKWSFSRTTNMQKRTVWVEAACIAFSTKLCLPEKGNVGEVFAALYVLLCADELRDLSGSLSATFAVDLFKWLDMVTNGGGSVITKESSRKATSSVAKTGGRKTRQKTEVPSCIYQVSFIQVCRNNFRLNSFCKTEVLEYMYRSGVMFYSYQYCKAIDMAGSVLVTSGDKETFHPLLISVKNWKKVTNRDVAGWKTDIKNFLEEMRAEGSATENKALGLILLLGCDDVESDSVSEFPGSDEVLLVPVPKEDTFGVSNAVNKLGLSSERSEVYSSHAFLAYEEYENGLLRSTSKNRKKVEGICKAVQFEETDSSQETADWNEE